MRSTSELTHRQSWLSQSRKFVRQRPALGELDRQRLELVAVALDQFAGKQRRRRPARGETRIQQLGQLGGKRPRNAVVDAIVGIEFVAAVAGVGDDPARIEEQLLRRRPVEVGVDAAADAVDLLPRVDFRAVDQSAHVDAIGRAGVEERDAARAVGRRGRLDDGDAPPPRPVDIAAGDEIVEMGLEEAARAELQDWEWHRLRSR